MKSLIFRFVFLLSLFQWSVASAQVCSDLLVPANVDSMGSYQPNSFVLTNEGAFHSFYQDQLAERLGGGYVGIGTDQNFAMMFYQKAEFAWIFDQNRAVIYNHLLMRVAFLEAETPDEFLAFFAEESSRELVQEAYRGSPFLPSLLSHWDQYVADRDSIFRRELIKRKRFENHLGQPAGFIADDENFAFIKKMHQENRIRFAVGFHFDPAIANWINEQTQDAGVMVHNVYLSNSHEYQYHRNPKRLAQNLSRFPHDENTNVLTSRDPRYSVVVVNYIELDRLFSAWDESQLMGEGQSFIYGWKFYSMDLDSFVSRIRSVRMGSGLRQWLISTCLLAKSLWGQL